jgi:hypothetical protein
MRCLIAFMKLNFKIASACSATTDTKFMAKKRAEEKMEGMTRVIVNYDTQQEKKE